MRAQVLSDLPLTVVDHSGAISGVGFVLLESWTKLFSGNRGDTLQMAVCRP